ncbi:MAG: hypothetical protein WCP53_16375, partial [Verrucomicrobiota bacterium]
AMDPKRLKPKQREYLRRFVEGDTASGGRVGAPKTLGRDITDADLWEQANELASKTPSLGGQDAGMAEQAMRKVKALTLLDDLVANDSRLADLGADMGQLRLVQGHWRWKGGGPAMPDNLRAAARKFFSERGQGAMASDVMVVGDEEAWGMVLGGLDGTMPQFMSYLTKRQRNQVSSLSAGHSLGRVTLDDAAAQAVKDGFAYNSEQWLEQVVSIAERRSEIIAQAGVEDTAAYFGRGRSTTRAAEANARLKRALGEANAAIKKAKNGDGGPDAEALALASEKASAKADRAAAAVKALEGDAAAHDVYYAESPGIVGRQADMRVPEQYVSEARAVLEAEKASTSDYWYQSVWLPDLYASVSKILDNPLDLMAGLRSIVSTDPTLTFKAHDLAVEKGVTEQVLLSDPVYATDLRKALLPEDYKPRTPGVVSAETSLDQLVLDGDTAAVSQLSADFLAASESLAEPVQTMSAAAALARPRVPSREWTAKLSGYGADMRATPDEAILSAPGNRVG